MQIAFIFARGGSKGVLRKNIREVAGKPLIAHTISTALQCAEIDRVVVSTDSLEISSVAKQFGAEVLLRPDELAQDTSAEIDAWRHAVESFSGDIFAVENPMFLSLPATSPLRSVEDISKAIERFRNVDCDVLFGISPSHRNPFLNMVEITSEGYLELVNRGSGAVRRQDVPDVYDVTTAVYVADPSYIQSCSSLMAGTVGYSIIPAERALDIDTEFDLHLADLLLREPFKFNEINGQ